MKLKDDEEQMGKIQALDGDPDEVKTEFMAIGKEQGFDFSAEDVEAAVNEMKESEEFAEGELTQNEAEALAGGGGWNMFLTWIWHWF